MAKSSRLTFLRFILKRSRRLQIGLCIFGFLVVYSIIGLFLPANAGGPNFAGYQPPSLEHFFGTDAIGHDIFIQTLIGSWYSMEIGVIAGSIATLLGVVVGGFGAYFGRIVDEVASGLTNVVITIPTLALLLVIASFSAVRSQWTIIFLIAIVSWPATARAIRAQVLSLKSREFVDVAKQSGLSRTRVLVAEVLPNMLGFIVMSFATMVGGAVIAESSLSALGLGPSSVTSLGIILYWAITFQAAGTGIWWWLLPPGILITLYPLSLLLIKDGLGNIFNPRTRK
ncbi:MAG: ABC transporter permease [Candidatus Bathyarchaeia archaeon]